MKYNTSGMFLLFKRNTDVIAGALVAILDHKDCKDKKLHPKDDRLIKLEGT